MLTTDQHCEVWCTISEDWEWGAFNRRRYGPRVSASFLNFLSILQQTTNTDGDLFIMFMYKVLFLLFNSITHIRSINCKDILYSLIFVVDILLGWPEFYLNRLASRDPENVSVQLPAPDVDSLRALVRRMQVSSYSTVFSGIDSPGTAFAQLRRAAEAILGTTVDDPEHVHAVDTWNKENVVYI